MRRWVSIAQAVSLFALLLVGVAAPVAAQRDSTPIAANSLADALERGRELEASNRWGEALTHYEEALKLFTNDTSIRERIETAKVHYSISRRYADHSFRQSLTGLTSDDALALYGEVLLKIQSHYVDDPDWADLVAQGVAALDIALEDEIFVDANLRDLRPGWREAYLRDLQTRVAGTEIRNRHDALEADPMCQMQVLKQYLNKENNEKTHQKN